MESEWGASDVNAGHLNGIFFACSRQKNCCSHVVVLSSPHLLFAFGWRVADQCASAAATP